MKARGLQQDAWCLVELGFELLCLGYELLTFQSQTCSILLDNSLPSGSHVQLGS